ncbi:MAG: hypothetical protein ACR2FV_16345 [Ornithinimicrobium sp.]|uniref:hypothetical protein n=1 Tax=Ornithinimicrobium sp. TaxID=1977084 RepID=UPI003D9B8F74
MVPPAETGGRSRPGLGPLTGELSVLTVMRYLDWQWCGGANYLKVSVPPELRSPSREEAQIQVDGLVDRITLFMGKSDWELDWHVYPVLEPAVSARLARVGKLKKGEFFCEFMGIDRWEDEILGRQWWSSDIDGILSLRWPLANPKQGAETASMHWSLVEDDHQGGSGEVVAKTGETTRDNAAIIGKRVYLQGAFVMDAPTDTDNHAHLEIHPLDSIAYASDQRNQVLTARGTESGWPRDTVVWRVGAVSNAGFHRINGCGFMQHDRTTVWFLDLPSDATFPTSGVRVTASEPGFWHFPTNGRFTSRGVRQVQVEPPPDGTRRGIGAFPADPRDGRRKLRVEVTMRQPDDWGGLFLNDFRIVVDSGVVG